MSFDLQKIFESKRFRRQDLVTRPIVEKLRMLDAMRERQLAIRGGVDRPTASSALGGESAPYRLRTKNN